MLVVDTWWVAPNGLDSNPCSQALPCRSINHVLQSKVGDGDIIKVRPGIYREQIDVTYDGITLEGEGDGVFIYGSVQPALTHVDGKWKAPWSWGASFRGTNFCTNLTADVGVDNSLCNTLSFWQNGIRLTQVLSLSEVVAGTFYFDENADEVWLQPINSNNGIEGIEGAAHAYAVRLTSASERVVLKNLNIWYGASMPDDGILQVEGHSHVIEDVDVRYSPGAGVLIYGADQVLIDDVESAEHGQNGWRIRANASFSTATGWHIDDWVDDLQMVNTTSRGNGWKGYDNCWGGGGTKFSFTRDLLIDGLYSADNNGFGIWLDIENHNYAIRQSMSARDAGRGIFVEYISDNGVVENNVVFGTKDADAIGCGISVGLAAADSRNVMIKNNTVYSTEDDVKGMMLKTGCPTCRSFPYESEHITWENNLLINKDDAGFVRDLDAGTANPFTFIDMTIEEEFAGDGSVVVCWDGAGNCTENAFAVDRLSSGVYLEDVASECGFLGINNIIAGKGAHNFVHPRSNEICGGVSPPVPTPSPPIADFTYRNEGLIATFTDGSTDDGTITSWTWLLGDGNASSAQHPIHHYAEAGIYTVSLSVEDNDGLTSFIEKTIEVEAQQADFPPTADFQVIVDGLEASFTDVSSDGEGKITSWNWDFGDGSQSSEQNPEHIYIASGTYVVTLTVLDEAGQPADVIKELRIQGGSTDDGPFLEEAGLVVMEAENYVEKKPNLSTGDSWEIQVVDDSGISTIAMQAIADDGDIVLGEYKTGNAMMRFPISIQTLGTYYIWLRVLPVQDGNSVFAGCENQSTRMGVGTNNASTNGWVWYGMKNERRRAFFEVREPGEKNFAVWMREDGIYIDRILITTDAGYVPEGVGPAESSRATVAERGQQRHDRLLRSNESTIPAKTTVYSPYPNPASVNSILEIDLVEDALVQGRLYDLLGREVGSINLRELGVGARRQVEVDVSALSTGVYLYRLQIHTNSGIQMFVGKLSVIRRD